MAEKKALPVEHRDEAEILARKPYSVLVIRDMTAEGKAVFLAVNPELEGCMAHGETSEEAIKNLQEARTDYIQVCLISGTPVPTPAALEEEYTRPSGTVFVPMFYNPPKKEDVGYLVVEAEEPENHGMITEYAYKVLSPSGA
jgi:predicted RNase H-like HicB family nuclease